MHSFSQLEELDLSFNKINKIIAIKGSNLKMLNLQGNKIPNLGQLMRSSTCKSIENINLESSEIEDMMDFPFERVKSVNISYNFLNNVNYLANHLYSNMESLSICNCRLVAIPKLNAPRLNKLLINSNEIKGFKAM